MTTGHDIGSIRLDDLDRKLITESLAEPFKKHVICNFGCGESRLSSVLALLGHSVHNYDTRDLSEYTALQQAIGAQCRNTCMCLQDLKPHHLPREIDKAIFQRVLHYLTYAEVRTCLTLIAERLVAGGQMYVSFSGIDSAIGEEYSARDIPIEKRHAVLSKENQEKFAITEPVCLYSTLDVEVLIQTLPGLSVQDINTSDFGNIRVVIQKK